jgi:hypothetical protein
MGRAAGAREVNVGWTNRSECSEQWEAKRGSDQEHRLVRPPDRKGRRTSKRRWKELSEAPLVNVGSGHISGES